MNQDYKSTVIIGFILVSMVIFSGSIVGAENDEWITADISEEDVTFKSGEVSSWFPINNEAAYQGQEKASQRSNYYVEFTFTGNLFRWLGSKGPQRGKADIYHNGELLESGVDLYQENLEFKQVIYEKRFEDGTHTIKIMPAGEKNKKATSSVITVDAFQYVPTLEERIESAKNVLYKAPLPPEGEGDTLARYFTEEARDSLIKAIAEGLFDQEKDIDEKEERENIALLNNTIAEFDESGIVPVIPDSSENNFEGKVRGSSVWTEGKLGKGIDFKGSGYVDSEKTASELGIDGEQTKTVELWAYTRGKGGQFIVGDDSSGGNFSLVTFGDDSWRGHFWGGDYDLNFKYESQGWTHFAVVHDESGMKIYGNGEVIAEKEGNFSTGDKFTFKVSESNYGKYDGIIDDVRIWDHARSQEQIENNMDNELNGDEEGLILYWTFNELK